MSKGNTGNIMSGKYSAYYAYADRRYLVDASLCGNCGFRTPLSGGDFVLCGADLRVFT
ncbi:hypothetical protein KCP78_03455 [Salmonella enterica subsp. enterica]|nr:hypothetical protein KCP78_03455 [Salmonella enterica subsp. enterica]